MKLSLNSKAMMLNTRAQRCLISGNFYPLSLMLRFHKAIDDQVARDDLEVTKFFFAPDFLDISEQKNNLPNNQFVEHH